MNCDKCQELISDLLDGSLNSSDQLVVRAHLNECPDCASVHRDLSSIVAFCSAHRGEYDPVPNQQALWLRIRNIVEAEGLAVRASSPARKSGLAGLFARSWEFSLPQLAAFATSIVVLVSLVTVVGLRRWETPVAVAEQGTGNPDVSNISDRMWQQQQVINYWNQRIEVNKVRWSPQMRETFDRNMKVIDQAVSESLNELQRNPHDEVSEQMLNDALNDKLSLLKEFSDL